MTKLEDAANAKRKRTRELRGRERQVLHGPAVCVESPLALRSNSYAGFGQASSALQNSDSESIKGRIMRANCAVRPLVGSFGRALQKYS